MRFIWISQGWFNLHKSMLYTSLTQVKNNTIISIDVEKTFAKFNSPTFMIKTFTKVGMEKINLSIIKSIYVVPAVVQWIKDLVLSQLWHRLQLLLKCDLWPGSFHMPWVWPKKINKLNKKLFITNPQPILNKEKLKSFLLKLRTRQGYSHHFYSTLYWKP